MLGVALVALVIGEVADQVVGSSGAAARRSVASWTAAVGPMVDESSAVAPVLAALRQGATTGTRAALERQLGFVTSEAGAVRDELANLPLAPPTVAVGAALARCFDERAAAAEALAAGIAQATDPGGGPGTLGQAQADMARAAADLQAGDAAYVVARRLLPRQVRDRLPRRSVWLTKPAPWSATALDAWVGALRGDPALAARARLSLTAVTVSPRVLEIRGLPTTTTSTTTSTTTTTTTTLSGTNVATGTTGTGGSYRGSGAGSGGSGSSTGNRRAGGTPTATLPPVTTTTLQLPPAGSLSVLQPTGDLTVAAVVSDNGALPVEGVTLTAVLAPDGGGTAQRVTRRIGALAPGAARYVVLHGLHPRRGDRYQLAVTLAGTGAAPLTDRVALCDASASGRCP